MVTGADYMCRWGNGERNKKETYFNRLPLPMGPWTLQNFLNKRGAK